MTRLRLFVIIGLALGAMSALGQAQLDRKWYLNYLDGVEQIKNGNYQKGIDFLEIAIAQKGKPDPNTKFYGVMRGSYIPYFYLGVAYHNMGQYELAKHNFEKSLTLGAIKELPELSDLNRSLADINGKLAQKTPPTGPATPTTPTETDAELREFQRASDLYNQGKLADAIPLLEKIRTGGGRYAGDADRIVQRIQAGQALEAEVQGLARQADEAFRKSDWATALDRYQAIYKKKPDFPNLLEHIDRCQAHLNLQRRLDDARRLAPNNPSQAEEILMAIRAEQPGFPGLEPVQRLVTEEKRKKELGDRSAAFAAYFQDGIKAYNERNWDRARRHFQDARKLAASPDQGREIQGYLDRIDGQLKQAGQISQLVAAARRDIQAGRNDPARQSLQQALALDPNNSEAKTLMGMLQSAGSGQAVYQTLLKNGIRDYFLGKYPESVASMKNYLSFSAEKAGLANFFIGAALVSEYYLARERSAEQLDEGRRHLRESRQSNGFTLPPSVRAMLSPRILELFERGAS